MRPSRETNKSHLRRIATKGFDVILHPFEQQDLIVEAKVQNALVGSYSGRQKAKRANAAYLYQQEEI